MKRLNMISILLVCCLLISVFPVNADEIPEGTETKPEAVLQIHSLEEFLEFSESCRLDSFSQNLMVSLEADIDLTGQDFSGIAVFCGKFSGNGHTISGLTLQHTGSTVGLFRYLTQSAVVTDLKITGTIAPEGSASEVGGIAGNNAGSILSCSFSGTVSGTEHIGGIAGTNTATGIIKNCSAEGTVYGNHFAGGIIGSNFGSIQDCTNTANINTELQQNDVSLSDITIDSLTGTESAGTVTDIGGITGISSGTVIGCNNQGNVGYPRIGYNIGGVAGSQTGYLADCVNSGAISGRKDVGGIVGQLEPAVAVTYSIDALQILKEQVNDLSALVNTAAGNVENSVSSIKNQLILIQGRLENATDALSGLVPEEGDENPIPSEEEISGVLDTLEETVTGISSSLGIIYDNLSYAESVLSRDIQNISDAVAVIQQTLNNSSDNLGGSVTDHSDADTDGDLTAKVEGCQNSGMITADLNGGGIAGTIAFENDLDPEADIEVYGDSTLNFSGAYRAVIKDCNNTASISVKKQYAGGIVGFAAIGLLKGCTNGADISCESATYVGGIAGRSDGQIRSCSAKSRVTAETLAGGIAGQGKTVSDCLSMAVVNGSEKVGTVLGYTEDISQLSNNHYMLLSQDQGAIDGISYDAAAQGLTVIDFLAAPELPDFFRSYTVTFSFQDGTTQDIVLNTDEAFSQEMIPVLPDIDGCKGCWIGLENISLFDCTVTCSYETRFQVIQTDNTRQSGLPILMAEGSFLPQTELTAEKQSGNLAENAIEGWNYACPGSVRLRYLPPENQKAENLLIMLHNADGSWRQIPHTVSGSYLVFTPDATSGTFCIVPAEHTPWGLYIGAGAAILVLAGVISAVIIKRRKKAKTASAVQIAEP